MEKQELKEKRVIFLKELKRHGLENNIPNVSETNARFLRDLIKISNTKNILEIGTANGYSAIQMGLELEKIGGKLTTIEFSANSYNVAKENIKEVALGEIITQINGNALDEIPKLEEEFDFVFIDGMKRRTLDFLQLIWDKVTPGGIIIIDDVIKFKEKMIGLWDYLKNSKIKYNIIPIDIDDGILMIIK